MFYLKSDRDTNETNAFYLIAENEERTTYEPIGEVTSEREALEIIDGLMCEKFHALENEEDPGLCPYEWVGWAKVDGKMQIVWRLLEDDRK